MSAQVPRSGACGWVHERLLEWNFHFRRTLKLCRGQYLFPDPHQLADTGLPELPTGKLNIIEAST